MIRFSKMWYQADVCAGVTVVKYSSVGFLFRKRRSYASTNEVEYEIVCMISKILFYFISPKRKWQSFSVKIEFWGILLVNYTGGLREIEDQVAVWKGVGRVSEWSVDTNDFLRVGCSPYQIICIKGDTTIKLKYGIITITEQGQLNNEETCIWNIGWTYIRSANRVHHVEWTDIN